MKFDREQQPLELCVIPSAALESFNFNLKETLPVNSCSGLPLAYNLPQTLVLGLRLQFSPSSL